MENVTSQSEVKPRKTRAPKAKPGGNGAAGPRVLDRMAILGAYDLPVEAVEVPQWEGSVMVRSLNGAQRIEYEQRCEALRKAKPDDPDTNMNLILLLVVFTAVDANGAPIFTEDDLPDLKQKNFDACKVVFEKALVLNGMRPADIEELAGN